MVALFVISLAFGALLSISGMPRWAAVLLLVAYAVFLAPPLGRMLS